MINNATIIEHSNTIRYRSLLCLCTSYHFRKRKQPGSTVMMNTEIPNTLAAVQNASLMSNLYLRQVKVYTPLGTWLQSSGSTSLNKSKKVFVKKQSTSYGLQECWSVCSSRNSYQNTAVTQYSMNVVYQQASECISLEPHTHTLQTGAHNMCQLVLAPVSISFEIHCECGDLETSR